MEIACNVAVMTGGGGGIGRGIGLSLVRAGADVVLADIDIDRTQAVAGEVRELARRGAHWPEGSASRQESTIEIQVAISEEMQA